MASDLKFKLSQETLTIRDVFERYGHLLPMIIQVTQGHFGETNMLTYSAGHTMRLHCIAKQQRVIAKDVNGKFFSFPVNYAIKFRVAKSSKKAGKEQTLKEIVGETTLPVRIELCLPPAGYSLHIGESIKQIESFGVLHLQQTYEESYFLANSVIDETIDEEILSVPVYLNDLGVAIVDGIEGKHHSYFQGLKRKLDDQAATFDYNVPVGDPDIAVYDKSLSPNTQPTHYIRYGATVRKGHGAVANFHDIRRRFHNRSNDDTTRCHSGDYSNKIINEDFEKGFADERPPIPLRKRTDWPTPNRVIATKFKPKDPEYVNQIGRATVSPLAKQVTRPENFPPIPAIHVTPTLTCPATDEHASGALSTVTPDENYVKEFTIKQIGESLKCLKLEKYATTFEEDQISGDILLELSPEILKSEYGMKSVEAIKLMKYARSGYLPK